MRFLLDQNQSPPLIELLAAHGHETQHVRDLGMRSSSDVDILEAARRSGHVIRRHRLRRTTRLIRRNGPVDRPQSTPGTTARAHQIVALLLANLDVITDELEAGAIVVLDADRIRVRRLPINPD